MRQDYAEFQSRGAEIIALGPDGPNAFRTYWAENTIPFIGLADVKSKVADRFNQEVKLLKLGRLPAIYVLDSEGRVRYSHFGDSMSDIPENAKVLAVLDAIKAQAD